MVKPAGILLREELAELGGVVTDHREPLRPGHIDVDRDDRDLGIDALVDRGRERRIESEDHDAGRLTGAFLLDRRQLAGDIEGGRTRDTRADARAPGVRLQGREVTCLEQRQRRERPDPDVFLLTVACGRRGCPACGRR